MNYKALDRIIKERGTTRRKLAIKAGVSPTTLQSAFQAINTAKSVLPAAAMGMITGGTAGAIGAGLIAGAGGIYNTLQSAMPQVETSGSNGSFLTPAIETRVLHHFYKIVDENIIHKGRPLCSMRTIKNLTGFILCADADVDMDCYDEERKKIGEYLVTGFFWE